MSSWLISSTALWHDNFFGLWNQTLFWHLISIPYLDFLHHILRLMPLIVFSADLLGMSLLFPCALLLHPTEVRILLWDFRSMSRRAVMIIGCCLFPACLSFYSSLRNWIWPKAWWYSGCRVERVAQIVIPLSNRPRCRSAPLEAPPTQHKPLSYRQRWLLLPGGLNDELPLLLVCFQGFSCIENIWARA